MQLEKPQFFSDTKSLLWVFGGLWLVVAVRLWFTYGEYKAFVAKPFYYTYADVLTQKTKERDGKRYQVLKLHAQEGMVFYTVVYQDALYEGKRLRVQIFPNRSITFTQYLGGFFVKSRLKEIQTLPSTLKDRLLTSVAQQHQHSAIASFYHAIFFATTLNEAMREKVARLGMSDIVALSGFHLAILWGVVYGGLLLLYRPLQQRFFPYRYALIDIGLIALAALGGYVWFVDSPPSLVRSFTMMASGWLLILLGVELVSFSFLGTVAMVLMAIKPQMVVSLSFWFSISGVFFIFLLLRYCQKCHAMLLSFVVIPVGVFALMLPVVHGVFGVTSPYQLLSVILSTLFILFYPLSIALHLIGFGGVFDDVLVWLFALPKEADEHILPVWAVGVYAIAALCAIRWRTAFWILGVMAVGYGIYLYLLLS